MDPVNLSLSSQMLPTSLETSADSPQVINILEETPGVYLITFTGSVYRSLSRIASGSCLSSSVSLDSFNKQYLSVQVANVATCS